MAGLVCDICGGGLMSDADGEIFTCESCGTRYPKERVKKMYVELSAPVQVEGIANAASLLLRADMFRLDGQFDKAGEYYEKVLDIEPRSAPAYFGRFLSSSGCKKPNKLVELGDSISTCPDFRRACEYADETLKNEYFEISQAVEREIERRYNTAFATDPAAFTISMPYRIVNLHRPSAGDGYISNYEQSSDHGTPVEYDLDAKNSSIITNPAIYIAAYDINGIHTILPFLEYCLQWGKRPVILCRSADPEVLNTLAMNCYRSTINSVIILVHDIENHYDEITRIANLANVAPAYSPSDTSKHTTEDFDNSSLKEMIVSNGNVCFIPDVERAKQLNDLYRRRSNELSMAVRDIIEGKKSGIAFGDEAIWQVLTIENGKALLITEDVIAYTVFDNQRNDWETSSIKNYLNNDWVKKLTKDERAHICDPGVFLLSLDEAHRYFHEDSDRIAKYKGTACDWWLRSPGYSEYYTAFVDVNGMGSDKSPDAIGRMGRQKYKPCSVRPAIWFDFQVPVHG